MNKQVKKPNVVRGGIAIPLGRNYYYMAGRKHKNGGIDVGKNPRTGLEVEDGEVMHINNNEVKVFSSVPFLNGKSPAQKVLGGENPNTVFKQQETFKDRNGINDDGTKKNTRTKAKMGIIDWDKVDEYADTAEKTLGAANLGLSAATLAAPNPYTAAGVYGTGLAGIGVDAYQGIRSGIKGNWLGVGKNVVDIGLSLIGMRALKAAKKWDDLNKVKQATGAPREYVTHTVGRNPKTKHKIKVTKEQDAAQTNYLFGYGSIPMSTFLNFVDPTKPNNENNTNNKKAMGGLSRSKDYGSKSKPCSKEGGIYSVTVNGNTKMRMLHSTGSRTKAKLGITVKPTYELLKDYLNELKTINVDDIINSNKVPKINATPFITSLGLSRYNNDKTDPFKMTKRDTISLASNVGGSLISAGINAAILSKLKSPNQPISAPAAKLKTKININPQLDRIRETIAEYERTIDNNKLSSRDALAMKQKARLEGILQTNELYGEKENKETELINADKLNQQQKDAENIERYNDWSDRVTAFENDVLDKHSENIVNSLGTINQGVQDTISRIEQRDSERQTRLAMLAAYPNVNPRILRTIGVKGITDADVANWEKIYYSKKNKQLNDRINETFNKSFTFTPATDIKTFESFNK